jgi:hypothetical protein
MKITELISALEQFKAQHGDIPVLSCNCIEKVAVASSIKLEYAHFDEKGQFEFTDRMSDVLGDDTAKPICWIDFEDEP